MQECGERLLTYMMAFAFGFVFCLMATDTEASIVSDPVALELKLEEMRVARMAKQAEDEAYWERYRRNQVPTEVQRCSRVYTDKGTYRKCKTVILTVYNGK